MSQNLQSTKAINLPLPSLNKGPTSSGGELSPRGRRDGHSGDDIITVMLSTGPLRNREL